MLAMNVSAAPLHLDKGKRHGEAGGGGRKGADLVGLEGLLVEGICVLSCIATEESNMRVD